MSTLSKKTAALAAYRSANHDSDWQAIAKMLADCIPAMREKPSAIVPSSDGFAPFAFYPINKYKADRVGPTCVVTFADGQTVRMSTATLPNKPLNVGRGLRLAFYAWQSRVGFASLEWPSVSACHFERNAEIIARFNPAECSNHLVQS